MVATQQLEVQFSARDTSTVIQALQSLGTEGQRALQSIAQASNQAPAGLSALSVAIEEVQGKFALLPKKAAH